MMTDEAGLYQGTLHGVVIPCWWATLYDYPSKKGSTRKNNPSVYDLYPDPPFMCAPDGGFFSIPFPVMICFSEEMKYWKLTAKSYLPIRMVRNAYDYSVEKIEPKR